ncbi:MAG TPA: hypothetical protein VMU51_13225 [Mycobacteriales bacterium]|nr:hypothetical protein [Mycobacteriales bacterium]
MRAATAFRVGLVGLAACLAAACSHDDLPTAAPSGSPAPASSSPAGTGGSASPAPSTSGSGPAGGETEGGQPKACTLVTTAEAGAALGRKVGAAQARTLGVFSSCTFVTAGPGPVGTVTVQVLQSAATAGMFDQIVSGQSGGKTVQTVPGVGDKAVLATGVLIFHKGARVVTVFIYTQENPNGLRDNEIALAKTIAAKL